MSQGKWAESVADLVPMEDILSMSGLDFLTGIVEGRLPMPPIGKSLDYRLHRVEEGRVIFLGQPNFGAMNPIGTIHGGWFGTLLDSCMACAVQSKLPKGVTYTTLEYKISILRPLFSDSGPVHAIGETIHVGRRTGTAEGRIVGVEDGKVYATGTTTCLVMPAAS
ncbi:MAG: PaaI family thioesterase [Pseudomonadota bacterium]